MQAREAPVVYLLGAMVPILLAQPQGPAERAHRVRIGLGPGVPAAALEAFKARSGVTLLEGYGSTETNFVMATAPDSPRSGVMGWLRPGLHACVVDADDVELAAQPGRNADPEVLAKYCESRLPYFAIPRYVDVVADLPRTENGKVQKYKLRERGVTASTWQRPETRKR